MTEESYDDLLKKIKELQEQADSKKEISPIESQSFFTPWNYDEEIPPGFIRLVRFREGNRMIKLRWGGRARGLKIPFISSSLERILGKDVRIFKGTIKEPGIRLIISLWGFHETGIVVDTKLRTTIYNTKKVRPNGNEEKIQLMTDDKIELENLAYAVNWRVVDPMAVMTKITNYKETLENITDARIRTIVGSYKLDELNRIPSEEIIGPHSKLVSKDDESSTEKVGWKDINEEYELLNKGMEIERIIIISSDLPNDLRMAMSANARARAEADGMKTIADAQRYVAEQTKEAAEFYKDNPIALQLAYLKTLEKMSEGKGTIIAPSLEELIRKLSGK